MQRFFFLFVFFPFFGFCIEDPFNGEADPVICHHVNVITGKLQLDFVDHVIRGAVPLTLQRSYSNYHLTKLAHPKWQFTEEWSFFSHTYLYTEGDTAEIIESNGEKVTYYRGNIIHNGWVYNPSYQSKEQSAATSYRTNVGNNRLVFDTKNKTARLFLPNGGQRLYKAKPKRLRDYVNIFFDGIHFQYLLAEEVSASGQRIVYTYVDEKRLIIDQMNHAKTKTFARLILQQVKDHPTFKIEAITSDGEKFEYHGQAIVGRCHLEKVVRPGIPVEKYTYKKNKKPIKCWMETISMENRDCLRLKHHRKSGVVEEVFEGGEKVATFTRYRNCTYVRDSNGCLTKYYYFNNVLDSIYYYDKEDKLFASQQFIRDRGSLIAKVYCDGNQQGVYSKTFAYDKDKNVIEETIYGNITGTAASAFPISDKGVLEGAESCTKWYKYNKAQLLEEEREEGGLVFEYDYVRNRDLLKNKTTKIGSKIILKESFGYDSDCLLIKKATSDGHLERNERYTRDPNNGMITEMDDGVVKITNTYNQKKQIIKESNGISSISTEYDVSGRVISKIFPCGGKNEYVYDDFGNPIKIKQVGEPWKTIEYDCLNRPIACEVEGRRSTSAYDKQGRVICEVDYKGGTTRFEYNFLGQCIKKTLPAVEDENGEIYIPEYRYEYDLHGNIIYEQAPSGAITRHGYTVLGKLIYTILPDGSRTENTYYRNGDLRESIDLGGIKTTYEYDLQHRLIAKKRGELEERWVYKGILLKEHTNEAGLVTLYEYDQFGRKILESCEGREIHFRYDELGRLYEVENGVFSVTEICDVEGRVVETSQNGFNTIKYEYDEESRKTKAVTLTSSGEAVDQFFYDVTGRLIGHINPLEQETQFLYEDYARTVVDPLGNRSIERFDSLYRVIEKQKQSPSLETLYLEKFFYDRAGNVKRRHIEEPNIDVTYSYDLMGRVLEEVEAGKKVTSFLYDRKGLLRKKTSPDGVFFDYAYDDLNRMTEMKSSDRSVWYQYFYDGLYMMEIKDHILEQSIKYSYTKFGEMSQEIGLSGFKTSWYYDMYGRTREVVLPDHSSIRYTYQGCCMDGVSRFNRNGDFNYEHKYTEYDLGKHVRQEQLIGKLGAITTERDILQRPYQMDSFCHTQTLEYNAISLITKNNNTLTKNATYSYDALNQLTQEEEVFYQFDSLGNPKEYEINDLNQIVSTPTENFSYDPNGNMIKRGSIEYVYDALHRLREILYENGKRVAFTYDPLSRLFSKENWQGQTLEAKKFYLYNKEFEIGSLDEKGEIKELKVLGLGIKGDAAAAIAIELEGEVFAPIHDLQGNVIAILNADGEVVERYEYNAFGEEKSLDYRNPWRFSSKRVEEGLLFFGFRFYDPGLKRWISPDPLGFAESRNVYLYVLNDPVNRLDLFGLESVRNLPIPSNIRQYQHLGPSMPNTSNNWSQYIGQYGDFGTVFLNIGEGFFNKEPALISIQFPADTLFFFTQKEIDQGYFNFFDHIHEVTFGCEDKCAYVSFMNGMNNSEKDFADMGEGIAKKFSPRTLLIGIYNETINFVANGCRAGMEYCGYPSKSIRILKCFNSTMGEIMEKYNPKAYAVHIAHSEGGLIYARAYEKSSKKEQERMQKYVAVLGVGSARPIKDEYTKFSLNIYSKRDFITGLAGLLLTSGCNIKWYDSTATSDQKMLGFIDHSFAGNTYSIGLDEFIDQCKKEHGGFHEVYQR